MSSFFRHLVIVRPIILRITSPMPMGLTPGFLSKGINLHALYGSISSGFSSSVANFLATLAIFLKFQLIVARSVLKYVSIDFHRGQMVHAIRSFSWLPS